MKNCILIVPRLRPGHDGVGDYALNLARELQTVAGVNVRFLCGSPEWRGLEQVEGFAAERLGGELPDDPAWSTCVLNYVGPGYSKNSCPLWLVRRLRDWKRGSARRRLITIFHEVYSVGMPWTRSFWTNPLQQYVVSRLARLSDRIQTSVPLMRRQIIRLAPAARERIDCVPIFSNVGESPQSAPSSRRRATLAVFGSLTWRRKAYHEHRQALRNLCDMLGIERVIDIGAPLMPVGDVGVDVTWAGHCTASQVAELLQQCRFGFVTYPSHCVGKSGIFAAYAAHRCIPVAPAACRVTVAEDSNAAPIVFEDQAKELTDVDRLQETVTNWYRPHAQTVQAKRLAEWIQ